MKKSLFTSDAPLLCFQSSFYRLADYLVMLQAINKSVKSGIR